MLRTTTDNPYSALFDYEKLAQEEEARKQRLQESQQRIQRTNVIGDALRLIAEGVTGARGASIAPRAVNPGIMQASQRYNDIEDRSTERMDRLRLQDLAMKEKGLTYDMGQQATREAREWEGQKMADQRTWEGQKLAEQQRHQKEISDAEIGSREKIAGINANAGIQEAIIRQKQQQLEGGIDGQNPYNQRWTQLYGKKAPYMTLSDVESGANIPLTDGQAMQIAKWMRNDPAIDPRTKMQIDAADLTNNLVFKQMVADNWDRYGGLVRKMALGQTITKEDQQAVVEEGKRAARLQEYQTKVASINPTKRKGAKELAKLNQQYADILQTAEPEQEELINTPIAPAGQTAPAAKAIDPVSATKIILPVAQSIYKRAETKEQVERDLKALVNSKYKTASPAEKAEIYNNLIKQF